MVVSNTHIVLCYLSCLSSSCVLCMFVSNTYSVVLFVLFVVVLCLVYGWCWTQTYTRHRRRQARQITQHYMCWTQPYTRHRRRQTRQIIQHYMCWTQPYTRHRTTTNKTNNTTQYVLDTTIHKTQDDDKQDK
jgi:preprotein translocase subunit SecY